MEQAHFVVGFTEAHGLMGEQVRLRKGNDMLGQAFLMSPASKKLARDRPDWTTGRVISEIDGVEIGNISIDLGRVVVATGPQASADVISEKRHNFNGLIAEIDGDCPPRPSGHQSEDTTCIAIFTMFCEAFPGEFKKNPSIRNIDIASTDMLLP